MISQQNGEQTLNQIQHSKGTDQAVNQAPTLPESSDSSEALPKKQKILTNKKVAVAIVLTFLFTFAVTFTPTYILLNKKIKKREQFSFENSEPLESGGFDENGDENLLGSRPNYRIQVAATIFNEARGESAEGRQAVAAVIYNRQKYTCPKCGQNHGLGSWQRRSVFHGYSNKKPNVPKNEQPIWKHCEQLAKGFVSDNTGGATHFQRASWGKGFQNLVKIGRHYFARQKTQQTRHKQMGK